MMGHQNENITIIAFIGQDKHKQALWLARCKCGCEFKTTSSGAKTTKNCRKCTDKIQSLNAKTTHSLIGHKFNGCEVVGRSDKKGKTKESYWVVRCGICKNDFITGRTNIIRSDKNKIIKSCMSCAKKIIGEERSNQWIGFKNNDLEVLERIGHYTDGAIKWKVRCKCGNIYPSRSNSFKKAKCCRKCTNNRHKDKIGGSKHWMWNPDLTDEERESNFSRTQTQEYTEWRRQVFKHDNYTCQLCGSSKSNDLVAHHLDGWDNFPEKRFEIDNGITLCEFDHILFHKIYGFGKNTKEQFLDFFKKITTGEIDLDLEKSISH